VAGIVVATLAVVAGAFGAGLTVGFATARASSPALTLADMMPGFGQQDLPYGPQGMPYGDTLPWDEMMPSYDEMHPPIGGTAYLGIKFEPGADGAVVTEVIGDSPAEAAGVQVGDIIRAVDGKRLNQPNELRRLIRVHRPGDEVLLGVVRGGEELSLVVVLGTAPSP
jgi:predicted metalloprotease with PDZ domain